jgi:hypothetical protein
MRRVRGESGRLAAFRFGAINNLRLDESELQFAVAGEGLARAEGIDCTTPTGKLQPHILAALAEFERERSVNGC